MYAGSCCASKAVCCMCARRTAIAAAAAAGGLIPPATQHRVQVCGALSGWSLLLAPEACNDLSNAPCVIGISPVLQALAQRAEGWDKRSALTLEQERMAQVMRDEIRLAPTEPLHLPMSSHPRLAGVLQACGQGSERSLEAWAEWGDVAAYPAAADDRRDGAEFCPVASAGSVVICVGEAGRRRNGAADCGGAGVCLAEQFYRHFVKFRRFPGALFFHIGGKGANQAGDEGGDAFVTVIYP